MTPRIVPVEPHGPLREVLPGVHLVQGSMRFGPARFSRNMVAIEQPDGLVLVNSVRLSEEGLAQLDALGPVRHVIRLAGSHGRDDPFYKQRYGCTMWAAEGHRYHTGLDPDKGTIYFHADEYLTGPEVPPLPGATLRLLPARLLEAVILLPHEGGTLLVGDVLQNWYPGADHFNWFGHLMFRIFGFVGSHRIGKGWIDNADPDLHAVRGLLDVPFENLLPAHGHPVIGGALEAYRPAIEAATQGL